MPEKKKDREPESLDDLILMIQKGVTEMPAPEPVEGEMIECDGCDTLYAISVGKCPQCGLGVGKTMHAKKVEFVPDVEYPKKKSKKVKIQEDEAYEGNEDIFDDDLKIAIGKQSKYAPKAAKSNNDRLEFNLFGEHCKLGYDTLVVYISEKGRLTALSGEPKPLDEGTLWMHYNVKEAQITNALDTPLRVYPVEDYKVEGYLHLMPGDSVALKGIQHVIVSSSLAKPVGDFTFIKPWMPIEPKKVDKNVW